MGETIYFIYNADIGEILSASKDYSHVQEVLTDEYMDTLYYEFLWNVNYYGMAAADAYEMAKRDIVEWFRDYMIIQKVVLD